MRYRGFDEEQALRRAKTCAPVIDLANRPFVAVINILAAAVMEILGPFCWAALIPLSSLRSSSRVDVPPIVPVLSHPP
jgi:hypothetical protein